MTAGFALLQRYVREASGLAIDDDKRYLVEDRLRNLLSERGLTGLDDLARRLHGTRNSELGEAVAEALTINETSFFRDRTFFAALADTLLPRLMTVRGAERRLRIWCAGCSTGQEPYSLAMVLDDMTRQFAGWQIEITATDLSRPVVEAAKAGVYSQFEVQRGLPVTMLLRHFKHHGDGWQISDQLRAKVRFRAANLLAIPRGHGPYDLVFCRNVLFYFDAATKRRVLHDLTSCLAPDGAIVLGGAERISHACSDLLAETDIPFVFRHADPSMDRHASSARNPTEISRPLRPTPG